MVDNLFVTGSDGKVPMWSIDDHDGHFKIRKNGSKNVLEVAAGSGDGATVRTGTWAGTTTRDWDLIGMP